MHIAGTLIVVTAFTSAMLTANPAAAQSNDFKKLSAQWWQWALSIPPSTNPLLDQTGADCMVGQSGDVWFLAGALFGGTFTRTCSVPEGVTLFFPAVNSGQFNAPGVCGEGESSVERLRSIAANFINGATVTRLNLVRSGRTMIPLQHVRRVQSKVFALTLPEDNVFDAPCAELGNVPGGVYSPAAADGVYVMVHPLEPGNYTLHIKAQNLAPEFGFAQDITYNLKVIPFTAE